MTDEVLDALIALRDFLYETVYERTEIRGEFEKAQRIISELWAYFHAHADEFRAKHWPKGVPESDGLSRAVADFITGMTDRYALRVYEEYFLPTAGRCTDASPSVRRRSRTRGVYIECTSPKPAVNRRWRSLNVFDRCFARWTLHTCGSSALDCAPSWSPWTRGAIEARPDLPPSMLRSLGHDVTVVGYDFAELDRLRRGRRRGRRGGRAPRDRAARHQAAARSGPSWWRRGSCSASRWRASRGSTRRWAPTTSS